MDSDDDDAPLTFRRGGAVLGLTPERPKPQPNPRTQPSLPVNAYSRANAAKAKEEATATMRPANGLDDDVPLSRRSMTNGPSPAGGVKRPAPAIYGTAQAKKPKPEPHPNPQSTPLSRNGPSLGGPKAPLAKPEPIMSLAREFNGGAKKAASNGDQFIKRQASRVTNYKEEEFEEEEEENEEEEEGDEEEDEEEEEDASEEDDVPLSARNASSTATPTSGTKAGSVSKRTPGSGKKLTQEPKGKGRGGGKKEDSTVKWRTLSHNGVIFPPPYTPHGIKMLYNGKPVDLTPAQEEVATMFAVMRETEYVSKPQFLANFWEDWKKVLGSKHVIQRLDRCDFTPIWNWHCAEKEKKKQLTSEEKKQLKQEKEKVEEKYMWAIIDGKKEKVGNFRVEPPGLFRGRGEHPKMGKLKRRIVPEDITINIGKDAPVPECPIPGHRWREVRHDNTVTWLAYWSDPVNPKEFKYVFLAASSTLKGLSDKEKYEKARKLKDHIESIRFTYTKNFNSKDETARQIAVATYLIDRLALRAGNEKDDDEADTVGCCSLKVEHCTQVPPSSLQFDFLGKDSIRYFNTVEVVPAVYRAIGDFSKKKKKDEDLFDRLDTNKLNAHLKELMPGLTAKVFRTYNASITLDTLLQDTVGDDVKEKVADYQRANKEVAILCNHQRSVSKAHASQMEKLQIKVQDLQTLIEELEEDLERVRKGKPPLVREDKDPPARAPSAESLEKKIAQAKARLEKMMLDMTIKDELKTVALGTSKINYMDPRITIAWCKRHEVPIEKVFNKSLLAKFAWAMDVEPDFRF